MADERKSSSLLPGGLIAVGVFFLIAGLFSGGPDVVGGIIFGVVSFAAAGAILHRRARDARAAEVGDETAGPGAAAETRRQSDSERV
jgi:hypothetical protein